MDLITTGEVLHLGTYNGNPLVMAAVKATLTEACTVETVDATIARNVRMIAAVNDGDRPHRACRRTPSSSAPRAASRGPRARSATTATTRRPTSTSRSPSGSTASTAACMLPPGLDDQWLISVMHDEADTMRNADGVRGVRRRTHRLTRWPTHDVGTSPSPRRTRCSAPTRSSSGTATRCAPIAPERRHRRADR